ncbi:MAG TPA: hypothetical protein PKY81_08030 [bacterium]|nr:hypothetical protein [bacterium]HPN30891.1 hypothetical protein [bacterium]
MKKICSTVFLILLNLTLSLSAYAENGAAVKNANEEYLKLYRILLDSNLSVESKNTVFKETAGKTSASIFDRLTAAVYFGENNFGAEYSLELKNILLKIPYLTKSESVKIQKYINTLKPDFQSGLSKLAFNKIENLITEHFPVSEKIKEIDEQKQSAGLKENQVEPKIAINADWFEIADRYKNESEKYDFINKLKHSLTNYKEFKNNILYVSAAGDLEIKGKIRELEFTATEKNQAGEVLETRLKVLYDFELINKITGKRLLRKDSVFKDYIYKTKKYSENTGITDAEAVEQIIQIISGEINYSTGSAIEAVYESLINELKEVRKKSQAEKSEKGTVKSSPEFRVFGKIESDYEYVHIDGNYQSAGEEKKETGRFNSKLYMDADLKTGTGASLKASAIAKYNNYLDKEKDLEKIYAEFRNAKKNLTVKLGNLFSDLGKNVFNNSYEGIYADYKISEKVSLEALAGREKEEGDNNNFLRLNAGLKTKWNYSKKNNLALAAIISKDDDNSIDFDSETLTPVKNSVISLSGKHRLNYSDLDYEFAFSKYDENSLDSTNGRNGRLIRINNAVNYKKHKFTAVYSRIGSDYFSVNSVLTSDREKYSGSYETLFAGDKIVFGLNSLRQRNNLERYMNQTEYLIENSITAGYTPFSEDKKSEFNLLKFSADYMIRDNYYKMLNNQPKDKDLKNNILRLKIENKFFQRTLNCALIFETENEKDYMEKSKNRIDIFEASSYYSKKIITDVVLQTNIKYRIKDTDILKDKYLNGGISLKYNKNNFGTGIDYYIDFMESSVKINEIHRQKFGGNIEYSFKKDKKNITFRSELIYEINDYERYENNYNKIGFLTNAVISF